MPFNSLIIIVLPVNKSAPAMTTKESVIPKVVPITKLSAGDCALKKAVLSEKTKTIPSPKSTPAIAECNK